MYNTGDAEAAVRRREAAESAEMRRKIDKGREALKVAYHEFDREYREVTQAALARLEAHDWEGMSIRKVRLDGSHEPIEIALYRLSSLHRSRLPEGYDYYLGSDGSLYRYDSTETYLWSLINPESAHGRELNSLEFFKGDLPVDCTFSHERRILALCQLIHPDEENEPKTSRWKSRLSWWRNH